MSVRTAETPEAAETGGAAGTGAPVTVAGLDPLPAIRLANITAGYRGRDILRDVSLEIAGGERLALVGPNGVGKSTLLRVLTGVVAPRAGSVHLGADPIGRLDRRAIAHRIAVVPGTAAIPFATRVEDVVALGRLPYLDPLRGTRAGDRAAVDAAIDLVGIDHLRGRDARELSLGERQLVLVAMAVAQRTPILVLDEPTVHLDLRHQVEVMELLVDLNRRLGITVLAVLHDIALAAHFFPRLVVLDRGRIVADDAPGAVLAGSMLRAAFGVDPLRFVRALDEATPETGGAGVGRP
jgi:iron complex transport system ATP-binding protein